MKQFLLRLLFAAAAVVPPAAEAEPSLPEGKEARLEGEAGLAPDQAAFAALRSTFASPGARAGRAGLPFQLACRDFAARFPDSAHYGEVRILAAQAAAHLTAAEWAQVEAWDLPAAERDPKLTAEQRAEVALHLANGSLERKGLGAAAHRADARLDALAVALAPHRATRVAREGLIAAALEAAPAKGILTLRETYPNDESAGLAVTALQQMGKICELELTAPGGRTFDLRTWRGQVVLLAFGEPGGEEETNRRLSAWDGFAKRYGATHLAVFRVGGPSARGAENALATRFQVKTAPYYLLFDRRGVLRFRGTGANSAGTSQRLELLLAEKPPARDE